MAITYGSNLGANSLGSAALIPVTAGAAADSFGILTVSGGFLVAANVPLTALQLASLNATYAALNSGDVDPLGVLSALVGVVSLDSANTVTLSMVGSTLTATCSAAGKVIVYVPNSASSAIVVGGQGASGSGGRPEYVANVPGLYLPGVACLVVPNFGDSVTIDPDFCGGFAQTAGATTNRDFRVEKTTVSSPDAVGSGDLLFNVRFASGDTVATIEDGTPANYIIATDELIRIVNPIAGDLNLADVAISLIGTL
jgi:hypothetical protein